MMGPWRFPPELAASLVVALGARFIRPEGRCMFPLGLHFTPIVPS